MEPSGTESRPGIGRSGRGESLHLRQRGEGSPVVFLGGCPTVWDVLAPIADQLTDHRCIEVALPGYGPSAVPPLPYEEERTLEAVERALLAAGVTACALVGFSGGAYRALTLALRDVVRVTHILSISGLATITAEEAQGFRNFATALRTGVDLRPIAPLRFLSRRFADEHPEAVDMVQDWLLAAPRDLIAAELEALAGAPDLIPELPRIAAPIVARVGAADVATPLHKSEQIAAAAPRGRLEVVRDAGHALPIEDGAGCADSLRRLLTEDGAPA